MADTEFPPDPELQFLFNHVFLPPKLPNKNDQQSKTNLLSLAEAIEKASRLFRSHLGHDAYNDWAILGRAVKNFARLHGLAKSLSHVELRRAFIDVQSGEYLILHVAIQNSALLFQKGHDSNYIVEAFEASPPAAEVLASRSCLAWTFPSRAVKIPASTFTNDAFQDELAGFLERASLENVKQFAASAFKANSSVFESRDTANPYIVGQLLMAILEAAGASDSHAPTVKRIRDDVCWSEGAEHPWRRTPSWLVIRVAIQRYLCSRFGPSTGLLQYKVFICFVMSQLCERFVVDAQFPTEQLAFARTKLARRVAKLQVLQRDLRLDSMVPATNLLTIFEPFFRKSLSLVNSHLEKAWSALRSRLTKHILPLPKRAFPGSTTLALSNSRQILWSIIQDEPFTKPQAPINLESRYRTHDFNETWANPEALELWEPLKYLEICNLEADLVRMSQDIIHNSLDSRTAKTCEALRSAMRFYHSTASRVYASVPELLSKMVLILFELWQALDMLTTHLQPLLIDYDPGFPKGILNNLQLMPLEDMQRIINIEQYLEQRLARVDTALPSVFSNATNHSYCVRHVDGDGRMQSLMTKILRGHNAALSKKKDELNDMTQEYEDALRQFTSMSCLYIEDPHNPSTVRHSWRDCPKCAIERRMARMRIRIHEAPLPEESTHAKCVVFELMLPAAFAAWREGTWQLLQLGHSESFTTTPPKILLRDYSSLNAYANTTTTTLTLGSWKKSFYDTHYAFVPFPATVDKVCLSHGLTYGLYDQNAQMWTSSQRGALSLAHICAPVLPRKSTFAGLTRFLLPAFNGKAPSSNEVIASQTQCPKSLTVIEYLTFQDMRLGQRTPWLKLLRELAAANLNLSSPEVSTLISQLALLTGPSNGESPLRRTHWVFKDSSFCSTLMSEIKKRLTAIEVNWRESQTVQSLLVLLLRTYFLASAEDKKEASELVLYVRTITRDWTRQLRGEICVARDFETAQKRSQDTLIAALLCRKTFEIEDASPHVLLSDDGLACFIECGICIKQNLPSISPGFIGRMAPSIRQLYMSDLQRLYRLESKLRTSIRLIPTAVSKAVNTVWSGSSKGEPVFEFSEWHFLADAQSWWVTAQTVAKDGLRPQPVHLDLLEGTFLVAGQPLGRLPNEYVSQPFFKRLFGDRVFMTYTSHMEGMTYMLASPFEGHFVHLGFRGEHHFVRVVDKNGRVLEYIPSDVFLPRRTASMAPDLPPPLVHKHVHWLDVNAQCVEIRRESTMWLARTSDWILNLNTCEAFPRAKATRLVDPASRSFQRLADVLHPFEEMNKLIVTQPEKANIQVLLPELELRFQVNDDGLLFCRQLRAVVDQDQDAGTLYGLDSKLVLRDGAVSQDRSIIVAMGPASNQRRGGNYRTTVQHTGYYARFYINETLHRLDCAVEPRLVYFKAYCHAVTSFVLPDPLTRRTGVDEALHVLRSGFAQPYSPLDPESIRILGDIGDLTPRRKYYPKDLKLLQQTDWMENLPCVSQHDDFLPLVDDILCQSDQLYVFHNLAPSPKRKYPSEHHLNLRAKTKNDLFRPLSIKHDDRHIVDPKYVARDDKCSESAQNTFEIAKAVEKWSARMDVTKDMGGLLQTWTLIQGYFAEFDVCLLTDLIDLDLPSRWGSLFSLCTDSTKGDKYKLMFLFGTLAFNRTVDMIVLRSLIAVAIVQEFKALPRPQYTRYSKFRYNQVPTVQYIEQFLSPHRVAYPSDMRFELTIALASKQRRKLEQAQRQHEDRSKTSCSILAQMITAQWPNHDLVIDAALDLPLVDVAAAVSAVKVEWQRLTENYALSRHIKSCQSYWNHCTSDRSDLRLASRRLPDSVVSTPRYEVRPSMEDLLSSYKSEHRSDDTTLREEIIACIEDHHATALEPLVTGLTQLPSDVSPSGNRGSDTNRAHLTSVSKLQNIVNMFVEQADTVRQEYGRDLQRSLDAMLRQPRAGTNLPVGTCSLISMISSWKPAYTPSLLASARSCAQIDVSLPMGLCCQTSL
jgi:hypothetical protein